MTRSAFPKTSHTNLSQAMLLASTLILSRYSTFLPQVCARLSGKWGWLTALFTLVPFALCLLFLFGMLRNPQDMRLDASFQQKLPPFLYRSFMGIYALAGLIYCALYLRLYTGKLSVMIFLDASPHSFSAALLAVTFVILTAAPVVLSRLNEWVNLFIASFLVLIALLMLPETSLQQLIPKSPPPSLQPVLSGFLLGGVWMYVVLPFLCGDPIFAIRPAKRTILVFGLGMAAIVLLVTWTVLAQLGPDLAASMYLPILFALRDSDLSLLARSEVLLATLWILGDVMFVCITLRMSLHTTGQALGFGVKRWMIPVFLASVYGISLLLGKNADRIQRLAETYFIPGNLILGIFLPGLACLIGAIRQKIGNIQKHRFRESQR